jgi:hypothetical protein
MTVTVVAEQVVHSRGKQNRSYSQETEDDSMSLTSIWCACSNMYIWLSEKIRSSAKPSQWGGGGGGGGGGEGRGVCVGGPRPPPPKRVV